MPNAPLRPCAEKGCSVLVVRGRCKQHARTQAAQRPNRDVRKWYYTLRWQLLRDEVLRDQAHTCAHCHGVFVALEVDHIIKHGGNPTLFWDRTNLSGLCRSCHQQKTNRGE